MSERDQHLRLAGVTRLDVRGRRGPRDAYLFDPHRLALPCWAHSTKEHALLVTLDRHFDLVPPKEIAAIPDVAAGLRAIDEHTRWQLDTRNVDHVIAAMEAGVVGDVVAIARTNPPGSFTGDVWKDRRGQGHRIWRAPTVDALLQGPDAAAVMKAIVASERVLLDVDLDCFTTNSDADPTDVIPWPQDMIRGFMMPPDGVTFWTELLKRCIAVTIACEPLHCGGIIKGHRLFADAADVIFDDLLGADMP